MNGIDENATLGNTDVLTVLVRREQELRYKISTLMPIYAEEAAKAVAKAQTALTHAQDLMRIGQEGEALGQTKLAEAVIEWEKKDNVHTRRAVRYARKLKEDGQKDQRMAAKQRRIAEQALATAKRAQRKDAERLLSLQKELRQCLREQEEAEGTKRPRRVRDTTDVDFTGLLDGSN